MIDLFQALILGIIQGLAEWLPISSSAHLALAQMLMGLKEIPVAFDLALHLGTLLAVFVYFHKDIVALLGGFFTFDSKNERFRMSLFILVAMVPTTLIGFAFKRQFESFYYIPLAIGTALFLAGFYLYAAAKVKPRDLPLSFATAIAIGVAQGISVAPGISRSGATISTGMLMGISPEKSAKFSFLLGIPALLGAAVFEIKDAAPAALPLAPLAVGVITSFIVGYLTIPFLMRLLKQSKLQYFAYYRWVVGLLIIALALGGFFR